MISEDFGCTVIRPRASRFEPLDTVGGRSCQGYPIELAPIFPHEAPARAFHSFEWLNVRIVCQRLPPPNVIAVDVAFLRIGGPAKLSDCDNLNDRSPLYFISKRHKSRGCEVAHVSDLQRSPVPATRRRDRVASVGTNTRDPSRVTRAVGTQRR